MKRFIKDFLYRGFAASGLGPIVLAVLYIILKNSRSIEILSVDDVCIGIFSLTVLAFISGGMNSIYKLEKLPLMTAILVHGAVLYVSYLITYLINDWLTRSIFPIIVFSIVFVIGYVIISACVYCLTQKTASKLNKALKRKT